MEYRIDQFSDDLSVWFNEKEILFVKRKFNFLGIMHSKIYESNNIIMEYTYCPYIFIESLTIQNYTLDKTLSLVKKKGKFILCYRGNRLSVRRVFSIKKKISFKLYKNDQEVGFVYSKELFSLQSPSSIFLNFYENNDCNYYLLLLLLMKLPTTMEF